MKALNFRVQAITTSIPRSNFPARGFCTATGISEPVVVAVGWTGNGSSSAAQPVSTKRQAIASELALTKRFMKKYESVPAQFAMKNNLARALPRGQICSCSGNVVFATSSKSNDCCCCRAFLSFTKDGKWGRGRARMAKLTVDQHFFSRPCKGRFSLI